MCGTAAFLLGNVLMNSFSTNNDVSLIHGDVYVTLSTTVAGVKRKLVRVSARIRVEKVNLL